MKNNLITHTIMAYLLGFSSVGHAVEDSFCHCFLIQIPNKTDRLELNEQEIRLATDLANRLSTVTIAAIYTSDEPCAIQTANFIASYHDVPLIAHSTLQTLAPNTLFKRVGEMRDFGVNIVEANKGNNIVLITHESIVRFIGRYADVGFQKIPDFSYVELDSVYGILNKTD